MDKGKESILIKFFTFWSGFAPEKVDYLPKSGSYREYCRLSVGNKTALGVYNPDLKENDAFISFSESFLAEGINVPEIYLKDRANCVYLLEDLGCSTLYNIYVNNSFNENIAGLYKKSLSGLVDMQIKGKSCIDFSKCTPRDSFDRNSMMWDLNYFKYFFLKLARIPFDEQALEDDFNILTKYLLQAERGYFLYRDFQSANIMIKGSEPYYIDYQGGRKGALQYDPASLLYDAKVVIPEKERLSLIDFYINILSEKKKVEKKPFLEMFQGFVLIRIMQAMAAFGFRGLVEHKPGFKESIIPGLSLFGEVLNRWVLPVSVPELTKCYERMLASGEDGYIKEVTR